MPSLLLTLLIATISSFGASAFACQADYYIGDTLELNTLGAQDADHAVIAVNDYGDVIVVNHTSIGTSVKAVEVNILAPLGTAATDGFKLFNTRRLGDPTLNVYQSGGDSCTKPDAEALGDNSFLVVWSRHEINGLHSSRLEVCRIFTRDNSGNLLAQPVISSPSVGIGFVIDDVSNAGDAGFMPDIAAYHGASQSEAYVVYAHEQSSTTLTIGTYRKYKVKCINVDWPSINSAPSLGYIKTLERDVPFDNFNTHPYSGGMLLPDAVIDDGENLVVAYEQYSLDYINSVVTGNIQLRRYSRAPFTLLDSVELSGSVSSRHQRRPMLATSDGDSSNNLLIAWKEISDDSSIPNQAHFRSITFNTFSPGHNSPVTIPWNSTIGIEDNLPYVAVSARTRALITAKKFSSTNKLASSLDFVGAPPVSDYVNTTVNFPWRPAVAILDYNNCSLGYVCFEGAAINSPNQYKIYLTIQKLH